MASRALGCPLTLVFPESQKQTDWFPIGQTVPAVRKLLLRQKVFNKQCVADF
ncbi:MAG: hypothetical protein RL703_1008 [Pseudomonadota bacterium]|jgi:hypothetical protein